MLLLTEGQVSDYKARRPCLRPCRPAVLISDSGYDADWFRQALRRQGVRPCIPARSGRNKPIRHGKASTDAL